MEVERGVVARRLVVAVALRSVALLALAVRAAAAMALRMPRL